MTISQKEAEERFSQEVVEKCTNPGPGCSHVNSSSKFCNLYMFPFSKWRMCDCPAATHVGAERVKMLRGSKKRVGQQKQRKIKK